MVSKPTGRPMGRPPKYSPELASNITRHLTYGLTKQRAADLEGVCRDSILEWEHRHPEFAVALEKAHAEFVARNALYLERAAKNGDARTAQWLLERRGGPEWQPPRQRLEVSTPDVSSLSDDEIERLLDASGRAAAVAPGPGRREGAAS